MALLVTLMMATPVMAIPESAIPVTATQTGSASFSYTVLNDGGIFSWHMIETGPVKLYITSTSTPDYTLESYGEAHAMINTETDEGGIHRKMNWTYKVAGGKVPGDHVFNTFALTVNAYLLA